ncbi:MAG TPA: nuclear transport factor 2 family protein [Longimicrobium sp.]|nr:nuclear transport factor 2 family protein [Longimicrobium sp.]
MRPASLLSTVLVLFLLLPGRAASAQQLSAASETAIRVHVAQLIEATNSNPLATLEKYVASSEVTSVNDETIVRGWSALVRQTQGTPAGSFYMQLGEVQIVGMGPQHALAVAPFTMSYQTNDGPVVVPGSMTLAFSWTADGWKIIHEHYSTGLDERSKQRLASAASSGSGLSFGDVVSLFLTALGGGGARDLAFQLAETLLSGSCHN